MLEVVSEGIFGSNQVQLNSEAVCEVMGMVWQRL
jgi:hypothetical protein